MAKKANVYMLRVVAGGRFNGDWWEAGAFVGADRRGGPAGAFVGGGAMASMYELRQVWSPVRAKLFDTRSSARGWARAIRKAGVRTKSVRFMEVT